jgi:hypothetical protein
MIIIPPPPHLCESEIHAMYWQMRNNGEFYIPQLGSHPISIIEWRDKEIGKISKEEK